MSNIAYGEITGVMKARTNPLFQYDYGQILILTGIDLPQAYEVHFCNVGDSQTISQIGDENGATIPDQFLQTGTDILAFLFLHTGLTDGETEYRITIPVIARQKPSDITPTPVQQDVITQAIAALDRAVEQTAEDAEAADASARDAEAWAIGKRGGVDVQEGDPAWHNNALYYAGQADASATEAARQAGLAEDQADAASESAAEAGRQAGAAEGSAEEAGRKAGIAEDQAEAAAGSAAEAERQAERAEQAANTAGYMEVEINSAGHLIYTRTDAVDVDFELIDGHLIMEA